MKIEVGDIVFHDTKGIGYAYSNGVLKDTVYVAFISGNDDIDIYSEHVLRIIKGRPLEADSRVYDPVYGTGRVLGTKKDSDNTEVYIIKFDVLDGMKFYQVDNNKPKHFDGNTKPWDMIFSLGNAVTFKVNDEADKEERNNSIREVIAKLFTLLD